MTIRTFMGDSLIVDVTVTESGSARDITGGTVEAALRSPAGVVTAPAAAITDASGGVIRVTIAAAALNAAGTWLVELELVIGAESQTVWQEKLNVLDALLVD